MEYKGKRVKKGYFLSCIAQDNNETKQEFMEILFHVANEFSMGISDWKYQIQIKLEYVDGTIETYRAGSYRKIYPDMFGFPKDYIWETVGADWTIVNNVGKVG